MKALLIIAIIVFAFICIYNILKKKKNNKLDTIIYELEHNTDFINTVIKMVNSLDFSEELENLISYDMFVEACHKSVLDSLSFDIDAMEELSNDNIKKTFMQAYKNILENNPEIDNIFQLKFTNKVNENISEAEEIEKEAVAYHESFGSEPDGDPELHSKEPNSDASDEDNFKEIDFNELTRIGVVEEFTDDLKEL